ncbi:hypothetical protein RHMOL_Rhmol03G0111900 [Rhododendron molle]|uniref:Uncharacterized protein n=2 Tax=Rhododendron molle TaxID=49168 RepID=A0ACC0PE40_RHOML|nr:hypothetical protein RHMOL_Rhmol03G0111900 [Rhododendron molle]KAI8563445.1 hypothetical protein RHMOL_Rhmol03G0111900 [Rhododendron molle]
MLSSIRRLIFGVVLIGFLAWAFQAIVPPPPNICGTPNGPPITAARIQLRDGRHLAYAESGVPKERAKYKFVFFHGFSSGRNDRSFATPILPRYGESDPDPKRTLKSTAFDVEELADQLGLGSKFYVIDLKLMAVTYIIVRPSIVCHFGRLAGAILVAPVVNYWLPGFPNNLAKEAYYEQLPRDQWAVGVAHYTPWLTYWWNTQKWFPASSVIAQKPKLSPSDVKILTALLARHGRTPKEDVTQQGVYESLLKEMMVGFGSWEFDPMDLANPFLDNDGSVHLWHGSEDGLVPVTLQRYIAGRLPWIHYHEVADAGHFFPYADGMREAIFKTLLLGEK